MRPLTGSASRAAAPEILGSGRKHPRYMRVVQASGRAAAPFGAGGNRRRRCARLRRKRPAPRDRRRRACRRHRGDARRRDRSGARRRATRGAAPGHARTRRTRCQRAFASVRRAIEPGASGAGASRPLPARRAGRLDAAAPRADRPRVLFASIVPPVPMDQGNRVVTRKFIAHLVGRRLRRRPSADRHGRMRRDGRANSATACARSPGRSPTGRQSPAPHCAAACSTELAAAPFSPAEQRTRQAMRASAVPYHPFFIVPDALVRSCARALCDAMPTIRSSAITRTWCASPRSSRPSARCRRWRSSPTMRCRGWRPNTKAGHWTPCIAIAPPETERDVLERASPGATVLAISKSEQRLFSRHRREEPRSAVRIRRARPNAAATRRRRRISTPGRWCFTPAATR